MKIHKLQLLEVVKGNVRKLLIQQRARAMSGQLHESLTILTKQQEITTSILERVALALLRSELLDDDLQVEEAEHVFDINIKPFIGELPEGIRFEIERNRAHLSLQIFKGIKEYYHLMDREQASGIEWLDYQDLFLAKQHAAAGEHYKALPLLWRQLRRAYQSGCWYAQRFTSGLFAIECGALGDWDTATHHLILSRNDKLVRMVAEGVTATGKPELTHQVIGRVLKSANLKRHFSIGCHLLTELADLIPDADIPHVADWLYPSAATVCEKRSGPNIVSDAWVAISAIGERLDVGRAKQWLEMALEHPAWTRRLNDPTRVIPERDKLVSAVQAIASVLRNSPNYINLLAEKSVSLLTDCNFANEYAQVLNLLCNTAEWGGDTTREQLAEILFPPGKAVTYQLAYVAKHFGKKELFTSEQLDRTTARVIKQIQLQVQRVKVNESPIPLEESIMQVGDSSTGLFVTVTNFSALASLAQHEASLSNDSITSLVRAMLNLALDRENVCSNRVNLLCWIREFSGSVGNDLRKEIVDTIEPLALGPILESEIRTSHSENLNPLNPFKFNMGSPDEVQAMAIVAFVAFAYPDEALRVRIWPILSTHCYDKRLDIRRGAYAAARLCKQLGKETLAGILGGLRDPEIDAAVSAFAALADNTAWKLERSQWLGMFASARFALQSPNAKLRRHTAIMLRSRLASVPRTLRPELTSLLHTLANDQAFSVRCSSLTNIAE